MYSFLLDVPMVLPRGLWRHRAHYALLAGYVIRATLSCWRATPYLKALYIQFRKKSRIRELSLRELKRASCNGGNKINNSFTDVSIIRPSHYVIENYRVF